MRASAKGVRVLAIKELLRLHGMNITEFARRIGFTQQQVSAVIHHNIGRQRPPTSGMQSLILKEIEAVKRLPRPERDSIAV